MSPHPDSAAEADAHGRPNIAALAAAAALARSRQTSDGTHGGGGNTTMGPRPLVGGMNVAAAAAEAARAKSLQKSEGRSSTAMEAGGGGRHGNGTHPNPAPNNNAGASGAAGTSPQPSPVPKKNYVAFLKAVESTQLAETGTETGGDASDQRPGGYSLGSDPVLGSIEPLPFDERADVARARGEKADLMDVGGPTAPLSPNPYARRKGASGGGEEVQDSEHSGGDGDDMGGRDDMVGGAGGGATLAAMAAAAAQKRRSQKKSAGSGPPPTNPPGGPNIAAMAAAAARKKHQAMESPNPVRWTSGTIVKTKEMEDVPPPPLGAPTGTPEGGPVNIAAMAAAAAQKKSTAKEEAPPSGGGPTNIAAAAAAAARRKEPSQPHAGGTASPRNPQSPPSGGAPLNVAAAAAAAARQKEERKASPGPPPGGIAALAAAAARTKEREARASSGPPPGGIAAMAAAAARKKEREARAPSGPPPGGMAATAAAAAREKGRESSQPSPPALPPGGIAAAAAAAARKKEAQSPLPPGGIAAAAAAAARKKEAQAPLPPGGIAAAAAAAARKKEQAGQSSSEAGTSNAPISPPSGGPMNIAAMAAAAARKKELQSQPSSGSDSSAPPPPPPSLPPGGIAAAAAAAAMQKSLQTTPSTRPAPANVQTPGTPMENMPLTPGSPRHQASASKSEESFNFDDNDVRRQEQQRARARRMQIARQRNLQSLQNRQNRRMMHHEFVSTPSDAVAQLMERTMDESAPPPGINKSYHPQHSEALSSNADDFMDVNIGTDADEFVGWKGRVRSDLDSLSNGDDASAGGSLSDASYNRETCDLHGRANCPGCSRSRIQRRDRGDSTPRSANASVLLSSLRSSSNRRATRRKLTYQDDPALDPETNIVHAKAAEALIRVIEMKELNFEHVLARLERYKKEKSRPQGWNKEKEGLERLYAPIDMDDYVVEEENDDDESVNSELSTMSANHTLIARNTVKLASHIMHAPEEKFKTKKGIPLKNDPEYGLYFRMLRYGFTIGAVRAALQRDGKPDITKLDPDKPIHQQRVPKVAAHDLDHELKLSHTGVAALERGQSLEIQGMEFGEEGLTDRGWESALESAKKSFERSESQGSRKTSKFRKSPLMPGSMTPSFLRDRTRSQGSEGIPDNESQTSALPPWLQSSAERGIVEGWLRKRTRRGRWVRRWYLLDSTGIYYAHSPPTSREARMKLGSHSSKFTKLVDARTLGAKLDRQHPNQFEVWHPSHDKAVATLRAGSAAEASQWVEAIGSASERLKLVDEVVVGQLIPENLVQNTVEIIQAREEAILESYKTPEPLSRGGHFSGGGPLGTVGEGEDFAGLDGDGFGGGLGYGGGGYGGFLEGDGLGGDGYGGFGGDGFGGGFGGGDGFGDLGLEEGEVPFDKFKRLLMEGTAFSTLNLSGDPKRPKLKRQNSWPPLSLMSDGSLGAALSDGKTKEQLEADLKRVEDDLQKLKAGGASGEGSGDGTGEKKEGDEAKDGEKKEGDDAKDADGEPKLKDDPKYVKYFNMMKVGLPKDVAKHAMTRDQLDPSILDLDPEKSLKSQLEPTGGDADSDPPLKDDPKYVKYFKMMKMGLPKEAAKHAMTRDQLDPSILDLDPEKSLKSQTQSESADDGPPLKDDPKYVKYFKMMKMGLPKEAAKHAMTRDQLDPSILDLDPEKSLKSQTQAESADDGPPLKDDPTFAKYFKMMKMGLPKEAAKHAMVRDQLDPSILDLDPEKSLKSQTEGGDADDGPPLKDDPKYVKYFKMLKMGLPKEAAQHAMIRDQLDPKILDMDPEKSLKSQMDAGPPLKDDPKYAKYFKMLKMGLPMGAVKNALTRDGLDPAVMDLDHDKPVSTQMNAKGKGKGLNLPKKPKIRRKKVYWNKVEAKEGTVWEAVKKLDIDLQLEIEEFEKLFSQAIDAEKEKEKKAEAEAAKSSQKTVKVIDSKRGMNGDIILRKIKMDPSQVASMIDNMDSDRLDAVELKSLFEFMPNEEEAKGLATYLEGQKSREEAIADMTPCEQYMVAMTDLKDSVKKFQSIIFLAEFQNKMSELKWDVDHLVSACEELRSSKRFLTLLACILILVNKINTGGEGGAVAAGFSLDSLTKLSETKAFDNKTTVLHYLVRVVRKSNKDVLKFQEDIKSVVLAKGVIMERLLTNAKALCEDSRVVSETAAKDGEDYRESLKNNQAEKYKSRDVKAQRASVKELRQMVTFLPEKDVPIGKMDTTHFERFALFSKLELQKALSAIKEANQNYLGILEYFGEDMKTQATDFFGMIDNFMEAFDIAADLVEKEEEERLKEARRALAKEAKLKVKSAFKSAAEADEVADALKGSDDEEGKPKKKSWRDRPVLEPSADLEPVKAKDYSKKPEDGEDEDGDDSDDDEEEESGGRVNFAAMAAASVKKKKKQTELPDASDADSSSDSEEPRGGIAAFAAAAARKKEKRSKAAPKKKAKKKSESPAEEDVEEELMDFLAQKHPLKPRDEIAAMAAAAARESSPPSEDAPRDGATPVPDSTSENVEAELMSFLSKRHPSKPPAEIAAMAVAASRESSQQQRPAPQGPRDVADPDDYVEAEIMDFLAKKHPSKPTTEIAAMAVAAARATEPSPQAEPTGFDPDDYIEEDIAAFLAQKDPLRPPAEIAAMAAAAARESSKSSKPTPREPSDMFDPDDYIEEEIVDFLSQKHPSKPPEEIAAMAAAAARKSSEPDPQAGLVSVADPGSENVEAELMSFLSKKHPSKPPAAIAAMAAAAARESSTPPEASMSSQLETSPKPAKKKSGKPKIIAAVAEAAARRKAKLSQQSTGESSQLSQSPPASEEGNRRQPVAEEPAESTPPSQTVPKGPTAMFDPDDYIDEEEIADFLSQKYRSKPPAEIAAIAAAVARRREESEQSQSAPKGPSAMFDPDDYIVEEEVADFLSHKHPDKPSAEIAAMAAAVARRRVESVQLQPAPKVPAAMFDPDDYIEEEIADFLASKHPSMAPTEVASMAAAVARRKEELSQPPGPESTQPPAVGDPNDYVEEELMAFLSQKKTPKPPPHTASRAAPASSKREALEEEAQSALMARLRPVERSSLQSSGALSIAESAAAAAREKEEQDHPSIDESPQPRIFTQLRRVERAPSPQPSESVDVDQDTSVDQSELAIDESTQPRMFTQLRRVEREPSPLPGGVADTDESAMAVESGPAIDETTQPRVFTELRHVEREPSLSLSGVADTDESAVAVEIGPAIDETTQPRIFTELRHVERPTLPPSGGSKNLLKGVAEVEEETGPAIDETTQPRIFTQLRHVERPALAASGGSRTLPGGIDEEESGPAIDESTQPRIFTQLRQVERPKQPPSGAHMNIAAMAAAAARQRGEQNESSDEEEQLQNAFMARLRPVERRAPAPSAEPEETVTKPIYSLKQIRGEPEAEEEDRLPVTSRPPPGLMNIAAAAAAAARAKEEQLEQQREEEARLLAERNAQRQQAKAEKRKKKAEARQVAEENARREQAVAELRQKEEQAQLKAGITNIAAMAALAAQRRSQAKEVQQHDEQERRRLAKEEAKKDAAKRAEQQKQEQYERERAAFERKQEARRQRAEQQRRELELETKELLKQQYHEDHVKREKLAAEKYEEAQRNAHLEVERREKAKREREERERLMREAKARKDAARQKKEEERQRKAEARRKKEEEREKWEHEMRERYEAERKEIEEQARMELEQERVEREQALRERKEQQRIANEERQKAQRAERLRRIKAEQERVDMQVKRATEHHGPSERQMHAAGTQEDAARRRRAQAQAQAQRAHLMEQRQKEEARRLVAEAERLKKRLANEKARASVKPRSSSQPRGAQASENVEAELMSWLSKKHPTKPGKAKAQAAPQKPASQSRLSSAVSQRVQQKPASQSRLSAAVSQAAKGRPQSQSQSRLSAAVSQAAQGRTEPPAAAPKSRLSMAVAAKASSQRKPPASAPPKASAKPADDDTEMELLNWVKHNQARPAEI